MAKRQIGSIPNYQSDRCRKDDGLIEFTSGYGDIVLVKSSQVQLCFLAVLTALYYAVAETMRG